MIPLPLLPSVIQQSGRPFMTSQPWKGVNGFVKTSINLGSVDDHKSI